MHSPRTSSPTDYFNFDTNYFSVEPQSGVNSTGVGLNTLTQELASGQNIQFFENHQYSYDDDDDILSENNQILFSKINIPSALVVTEAILQPETVQYKNDSLEVLNIGTDVEIEGFSSIILSQTVQPLDNSVNAAQLVSLESFIANTLTQTTEGVVLTGQAENQVQVYEQEEQDDDDLDIDRISDIDNLLLPESSNTSTASSNIINNHENVFASVSAQNLLVNSPSNPIVGLKRNICDTNDKTLSPSSNTLSVNQQKRFHAEQQEEENLLLMGSYRKSLLTIHEKLTTKINAQIWNKVNSIIDMMDQKNQSSKNINEPKLLPNTRDIRVKENKKLLQLLVLSDYGLLEKSLTTSIAWALAIPVATLENYIRDAKASNSSFMLNNKECNKIATLSINELDPELKNASGFPVESTCNTFIVQNDLFDDPSRRNKKKM